MVLCALLQAPGGQSVVTQPRIQGYQKRMQAIAHTTSQNATNQDAAAALRSMLKDGSVRFYSSDCLTLLVMINDHCQVKSIISDASNILKLSN